MSVAHKRGEAPVKAEYLLPPVINLAQKQKCHAPNNDANGNLISNLTSDSDLVTSNDNPIVASNSINSINQLNNVSLEHTKDDSIPTQEHTYPLLKEPNINNAETDETVCPPKKKIKGQNKVRPRTVPKQKTETRICPNLLVNEKCRFGEQCKFSHNFEECIKTKLPDLAGECVNFKRTGKCRYGIECRFSTGHMTDDYKNIIDEEKFKQFCNEHGNDNTLMRNIMISVRKRQYKFPRTEKYLSELNNSHKKCNNVETNNENISNVHTNVIDCNLNIRERKKIDFSDKLYLAPLTTLGNLPFRVICKRLGADITCGEMAVSTKLLQCHQAEWALIKRHPSEDIFGVQICGGYPDTMSKVTELVNNECNVDFIDINMGCPIDLIFRKGEGSALMGRLGRLEKIVKGMVQVADIPITIKMRTGIYGNNINAHKVVPLLKEWGVDLITLHGRTREQRYTKDADWEYINKCAQLASPTPLFGNGDVLSYEEANMIHDTDINGVMIARGALIKPWIFTEIKEQRHWDISSHERFQLLKDFTNLGLIHWGSDFKGVENTRRFLLEWLSFLCRYIPVGLLEVLPQKINERAPKYIGRDDLETIFGSDNVADWIKISEMLLGPVPDSFSFLPKHKANSYSSS